MGRWIALFFGATLVVVGCKTITTEVDFATDAKTNLARGNEALRNHSYAEAEKYFDYVRTKYPFIDASKEAELRLADVDFEREQFTEARDRYTNFAKLHPTHPKADYAAFRAAMCHYKQIPGDFFLIPPSHEKEQVAIRNTLTSMEEFVKNYPLSSYVPEGKKIVNEVARRLAQHEMYVADFYQKRGRWPAVVGRLENIINKYPGVGYDERALFRLHEAYLKVNNPERAQEALKKIIERFPGTDAAERAKKMLGS
jgi:outer membrane protein assembly factor BamD